MHKLFCILIGKNLSEDSLEMPQSRYIMSLILRHVRNAT